MQNDRSNTLLELARKMIKQAKMLRDAGLAQEARDLARRAMMLDSCGWAARTPQPVRIPVRRQR